MQKAKIIAIALLTALALLFVFQNSGPVTAHFLVYSITASQAVMLFTALAIGFLLGILVTAIARTKQRPGVPPAKRVGESR